MALKKKINTDYGIEIEYWKITGFQYMDSTGSIDIQVAGFKDKQAKDDLKKPLVKLFFTSSIDHENKSDMYNFLKTAKYGKNEEIIFEDSEDI